MDFLKLLLSDDNGNPSTMRAMVMMTTLLPLLTWVYTSFTAKALQPISPELLGLVLGPQGWKVLQKGKENGKAQETKEAKEG